MSTMIRCVVAGIQCWIVDGEWGVEDERFKRFEKRLNQVQSSNAPDPESNDQESAEMMFERFGGRIVEISNDEPPPPLMPEKPDVDEQEVERIKALWERLERPEQKRAEQERAERSSRWNGIINPFTITIAVILFVINLGTIDVGEDRPIAHVIGAALLALILTFPVAYFVFLFAAVFILKRSDESRKGSSSGDSGSSDPPYSDLRDWDGGGGDGG